MDFDRKELRKTERFHQIPIFSNLTGQETGRILRITQEMTVPAGTEIFKPEDPCDGFYIILDGRVDIRIPSATGPTTIATLSNRSSLATSHGSPSSALSSARRAIRPLASA